MSVQGKLKLEEQLINVHVGYATKATIYVSFPKFFFIENQHLFESLTIKLNQSELIFSNCRFEKSGKSPQFDGFLIFTKNVYDFYQLFKHARLTNNSTFFQNIPLIIEQKAKLNMIFKEYVSDLNYDLSIYQKNFNQLDDKYKNESASVKEEIYNITFQNEGKDFLTYLDNSIEKLKEIVRNYRKEEYELHGFYFRRMMWHNILRSKFLSRTNIKPRGYPGDSKMMKMVYQNNYQGNYIFDKLMHKHPIETKAAQAVRNRKLMVPNLIKEYQKNKKNKKINILSVACGPANEIERIITNENDCDNFFITFLDQDSQALDEALANIRIIEKRFNKKIKVKIINASVRTMLMQKDLMTLWGGFDYIYSMGLFDYLTTKVARAVIDKIYSMLLPDGEMLIGNYHIRTETRIYLDYWMDWKLFYRSEEDFLKLCSNFKNVKLKILFEESKSQMFLQAKRTN